MTYFVICVAGWALFAGGHYESACIVFLAGLVLTYLQARDL
jgi:hypothetical protein